MNHEEGSRFLLHGSFSMTMHLIGLDVGTTGCKALVFDPQGDVKGAAYREYDVVCTAPAMAEQDAENVWCLTAEVLREAVVHSEVRDFAALSLSVQGDAVIPVDREGRALHPAILGMDYRSEPQARACETRFGGFALFERTGMRPHPMNSLTKILFLRDRDPALFDRAWKMMTYADFILGKLGADPVIDHTMASRTMAFDLRQQTWSADLLEALDLHPSKLSRPAPSGTIAGRIRPALAAELGLPADLLLVTGGHDQTCAALGAGLVREGVGLVSTGTAEVLSTALGSPALTRQMFDGFYPCYLHARAGMYFTFSLNHVGGLLLKWYRDAFAPPEVSEAARQGLEAYAVIDARMPEGPSPLLVLPHLQGSGTPWCDLDSRGAVIGLTLSTTRHDLAKALLESLAFELRINLEALVESGVAVTELVAAGGGAKSARWLQLKADILGRTIRTLRCREAAGLGAAQLAGTAAGVYDSLDEAVAQTVRHEREYVPGEAAGAYADRYARYCRLYPALHPLNVDLFNRPPTRPPQTQPEETTR